MSAQRIPREEPLLRQAAYAVEQLTIDDYARPDGGLVTRGHIEHAIGSLRALCRPPGPAARREAATRLLAWSIDLRRRAEEAGASALVYLADAEYALEPRLRAAAIEIDFCFGNRDGQVSADDLRGARQHYGRVRGPVGWNRLLQTDELERRLFPAQTLRPLDGARLRLADWLRGPRDPVPRLGRAARHLDDGALARTYADVAARFAVWSSIEVPANAPTRAPPPEVRATATDVFDRALRVLGAEIRRRDSVRPTISDIARIGCEDPVVRAVLRTPVEMSRRLSPEALLDRYLTPEVTAPG